MDSYNKKEFQSMQEEAIARVREMQKRSQNYINSSNMPLSEQEKPPEPQQQNTVNTPQNNQANNQNQSNQNRQNQMMQRQPRPSMPQNPLANLFGFNQSSNNMRYYNQSRQSGANNNQNRNNQQNRNNPQNNNTPVNNAEAQTPEAVQNNKAPEPPKPNPALGPFAQLFGSNLGAFNKFKKLLSKDSEDGKKPLQGFLDGLLKDFNIDEEKIILGVLIYLLYKNGSDVKLLLALGYLLL